MQPTASSVSLFCTKCGAATSASAGFCQKCGQPLQPANVVAPFAAPVAFSYGGFWRRFAAIILDVLIIGCIMIPIAMMLGFSGIDFRGGSFELRPDFFARMGMLSVLRIVIFWVYEAYLTSSEKQATLGKMALGLRVTDTFGNRISFAQATGRHFAKYVSAIIMGIGYFMAAFTPRKQALHDMIAGTLVIKG